MEFFKKYKDKLYIIPVLLFGAFWFYITTIKEPDLKGYAEKRKNTKFAGIVTEKFIVRTWQIRVSEKYSNKNVAVYHNNYDKIDVGDSVFKKKGDLTFLVFKKDTTLVLDF